MAGPNHVQYNNAPISTLGRTALANILADRLWDDYIFPSLLASNTDRTRGGSIGANASPESN